ncbi:MAG TPA: hypothetical protein VLG16_01575 [Candidatus Saccharimonadales bacterium]|nr:hypothetical protein [Candidatus Saccharimonadales bacterium]
MKYDAQPEARDNRNDTYFDKKRLILCAIGGRAIGNLVRKQAQTEKSPLSLRVIDRMASTRISELQALPTRQNDQIRTIYSDVGYWHGTGRYQYHDGEQIDLLAAIAKDGGLRPQYDGLDFAGPKSIISTARSRMYSRAYADMHGKGSAEESRHGSSMFWAASFGGDFVIEQLKEYARDRRTWSRSGRAEIRRQFKDSGGEEWYKKVTTTRTSVQKLFHTGSDIPNNYPILFGVRTGSFEPAQQSRALAITEARSTQPLLFADAITHIEVPQARMEETSAVLETFEHSLPILALEDAERYAAGMKLSELIAGATIRPEY